MCWKHTFIQLLLHRVKIKTHSLKQLPSDQQNIEPEQTVILSTVFVSQTNKLLTAENKLGVSL